MGLANSKRMERLGFLSLLFVSVLSLSAQADVVLTMGGDVNFNRNRMPVDPRGVMYGDKAAAWSSLTSQIKPLINGDLNFANIETVISSRNDLPNEEKTYAFKSHPNSIRNLLNIGFNLFNIANNHSYDYGVGGMEQTVFELDQLQLDYPNMVYHGIGERPQLLQPRVFEVKGIRVAFASISISEARFRATDTQKGLLHIRSDKDFKDLVVAFSRTQADFKILSIHSGTESQVTLDPGQKARFEYALQYGKINLIIGHHPHVVRPIQKSGDQFIFYSLGNYLMVGSANITERIDPNMDWGMFSRLYLERDPATGKVKIDAVEVIPLTNTHNRSSPLLASSAGLRIQELNRLSESQVGPLALKLQVDPITGRGVFCGERLNSIRAKTMCAGKLFLPASY
jgi:poly-gamma-glutamate capsule biosynthesis protein CapA/YwtB (metallophosphatase superfamily)